MIVHPPAPTFKAFSQFNEDDTEAIVSSRTSVDPVSAPRHFPSDRVPDRVARALGARRATSIKELVESFEFFQQTRKLVRAHTILDLCCGHGLTGMLFAVLDRKVESVVLVDRVRPPCFVILDALCDVAPWTRDKVSYCELEERNWVDLPLDGSGTSVLGVHACGRLTDHCLDFAVDRRLPVAVMPCCYPHRDCPAPNSIKLALGPEQAFDVDRTYRLEAQNFRVKWRYIPQSITPMNRILVAVPA